MGANSFQVCRLPPSMKMLDPAPPERVMAATSKLRFRDLVIAAVMIDRPRVTNQAWI